MIEHSAGCNQWRDAAPGQRSCVCGVWNKGRPGPGHLSGCHEDETDCRCITTPDKWPAAPSPVTLTEDERQYAYPMEQGDFYLEDDVERIIAERMGGEGK